MSIPPGHWIFAQRHQRIIEAKRCIAASHSILCDGGIVRAHTIPRSLLKKIAKKGRVVAAPTRLLAVMKMQRLGFQATTIGIGEFSTLNCFCRKHDKLLFAPIEDFALTFAPEQLALLHYRAIAAEFYQRNGQLESAASEVDWDAQDAQNERFQWIFVWNDKAVGEAHEALQRTEDLIAQRSFEDVRSLTVTFDTPPAVMAVGAFRPHYTFAGRRVQDLAMTCCYVAMHMLAKDGKAALAFTWLNGDRPAEQFVKTFADLPKEQMASVAVQCAFEHAEHTCMSEAWWNGLKRSMQAALIERARRANSFGYRRSHRCLSYRIPYANWNVADIR